MVIKVTEEATPMMTIDEVAQYLHLHPLTVRQLAERVRSQAFKVGRRWRVRRELLDEWFEQKSLESVRRDEIRKT